MNINETISRLNVLLTDLPSEDNYDCALEYIKAIRKHIEEQDAVIAEIKSVVVDVSDINKLMWYDARKICRDVKVIIEKVEATNKPEYKEGDEERIFDCAPGLTEGLSPREYIDKVRG